MEHSQHHSGQHLLSAVCLSRYGYETVSFHLGEYTATIDLNTPHLTDEEMDEIENIVNKRIFENRNIRIFHINRKDRDQYRLRKIPDHIEKLRIVEIEGIEYNACGGTHVRSTAEIGLLKLLKTEKVRGMVRLHFICGSRLLNDYRKKHRLITDLSNKMTTGPDTLGKQIEKMGRENKQMKKEYRELLMNIPGF